MQREALFQDQIPLVTAEIQNLAEIPQEEEEEIKFFWLVS